MHTQLNKQGALEGTIDYLPIQAWFMKKEIPARNHFNHSFLIRVQERTDKTKLKKALEKLNKHHDMFRAEYREGKQSYRKESSIPEIKELDIRGKKAEAIFQELTSWQSRFNIEEGYIWQSGIIRGYEDGSERIYFAAHHLVTDAASWHVIREDLKALYEGKEIGIKGSSYRQWVDAVKKYGINATEKEKNYWQKYKTEEEQHLHTWEKFTEIDDREIRATRIDFSEETIIKLSQLRIEIDSSEIGELLLSGLGYALNEVSGSKSNWITIERQGREEIDSQIDVRRTVGWFTTMYPFCLTVEDTLRATILANKEKLRNVPFNGIGYGAIHGYDKLPKVLFNFLERLDGTTENNWQIRIKEASGESMSPDNRFGNIVDINGLSVEGRMGLWFESCLKEEHHKRLCEAFKRNVEALMLD
jgi:non-ribosomal peptide synthase protein (TIGR01720 family)